MRNADAGADFCSLDDRSISYPVQLEATGIYLSQAERLRFASSKIEQIIVQHQEQKVTSVGTKDSVKLNFHHCASELLIGVPRNGSIDFLGHEEALTGRARESVESLSLELNNQARTQDSKEGQYFRTCVPYQHHSLAPRDQVYALSFAMHPDQIQQPSGSLNMSRIDTVDLKFKAGAGEGRGDTMFVYARSYNVLRMSLGISGLGFSF